MFSLITAAYTEYTIWLKAFTWKNEGESSATIVVKTDVRGPFPPRIVNVSCLSEDALYIAWNRPTKFYNTIDFYYVDYRSDQWRDFEELTVNAHADQPDHSVCYFVTKVIILMCYTFLFILCADNSSESHNECNVRNSS